VRVLGQVLRDFRPGMRYDEFKWYDWRPGSVEGLGLLTRWLGWLTAPLRRLGGYARPAAAALHHTFTSSATQRSIRALTRPHTSSDCYTRSSIPPDVMRAGSRPPSI